MQESSLVASPPAEVTAPRSLKARLVRGSLWALVGHAGSQVLRLGGNLILWRLLHAEAFGLMAIVNVLILGLAMFSDVGIGPSIIQNERGDDAKYLYTAWTIQVLRGFCLFAVATVAAVPVARFYHQPELASLIPAVGFGSILAGFNSTKLFTATREIAIGRLTVVDLASQAAGLAVMVIFGLSSRSIWALVAGGIAGNSFRLVFSHALLPGRRNRLCWERKSAAALLLFGRWIFMSTLLTFMVMQSDRLIFGKLVSMSMLGVYSIATIWSTFPTQVLSHVFQTVLFPMLSRVHNDGGDVGAAYRSMRAPWITASGWLTACLVSGGPTLIRFLYDERAAAAGPILQVLSVGTWFLSLEMSNGSALLARGKPKWVAAGSAAKLLGMVILIPVGLALYGFPGAVGGFAVSELFRYVVSLVGAHGSRLRGYRLDFWSTVVIALTSLLGLSTRDVVRRAQFFEHRIRLNAFVEGVAIFLVVSAAWTAWALVLSHFRNRRHERSDARASSWSTPPSLP
jgi:O-antigen/teichoic acid export membrane protein